MKATTADALRVPSPRALEAPAGRGLGLAPWCLAVVGLTLATLVPLSKGVLAGIFVDPDDAMRLVEVRAWLHGQGWFDLAAHRLDPPLGASMHWSRLVDVPTGLLIALFGRVVEPGLAEALARIVVPTGLLVLLYVGMARLAVVLLGRFARGPALIGTALSGGVLVMFAPGRIGHHGPATVLLLFAVVATLESLDPRRAGRAAVAGGLVALSLGTSLETLPFLATLAAALVVVWIVEGRPAARALAWFGGGLGLGLPIVFLLTVGPDRWFAPVRDAFGAAHLGVGVIGAGGLIVLSTLGLRSRAARAVAAAAVGVLAAAFVAVAYPGCLRGPFAGVDPLVRAIWLDNVIESQPLIAFLRRWPMLGLAIAGPVALGLVGCLVAAVRRRGLDATRFAIVAAIVATGLALGFVQVRVFASVAPLALGGGLYAVSRLGAAFTRLRFDLAARLAWVAILPFTGTAWAMLPDRAVHAPARDACLTPAAIAPLAKLGAGSVVAPIDAGSQILVGTPLDVFAAPYHRDNDGNRFALDVFLAPSAEAVAMLSARHVDYVVTCDGLGETAGLAARAPDGLAAALLSGRIPPGLTPVPLAGTPMRVYAITK